MADLLANLISALAFLLSSFFEFLLIPVKWGLALLEGIFYLIYRLSLLLVDLLYLFLGMFQAVLAVIAGTFRTITGFLSWSGDPLVSKVGNEGIEVFIEMLRPLGLLSVLPLLLLALDIMLTGYLVMRIVGREE